MILTKYYSRKRSLIFAHLWDRSDRMGFGLLGLEMKTSLFVKEKDQENTSVWYEKNEFDSLQEKMETEFRKKPELADKIINIYKHNWEKILPFLNKAELIKDSISFGQVFDDMVRWGSAFNILYILPNLEEISPEIKTEALRLRKECEKYTETIDEVWFKYLRNLTDEDIVESLTPEEASKLGKIGLSEQEIQTIRDRAEGYALLNGEVLLLKDLENELAEKKIHLELIAKTTADTIKGSVAFEGKVEGKVRIITSILDVADFAEGQILVAAMTQPSYLPALKKAAAFVTDEGGITCHAAIVARELSKPCIIGTKIATKVLHDGDEVEVDAENGIVKILRKAK